MFRHFSTFVILALDLIQSGAFTLPMAISPRRTSAIKSSSTPSTTRFGMAVCDIESTDVVCSDTSVYKKHRRRHVYVDETNDAFEKWTLQLIDDSSNTRSYVCRCLVEVAGLSEDESYRKMMQTHAHGDAVIGEYSQEHAEHYKEALMSSGLVCEIFSVEE